MNLLLTHLALSQQGVHLCTPDNAMIRYITWNWSAIVNCPVQVQVFVNDVQIGFFTLKATAE